MCYFHNKLFLFRIVINTQLNKTYLKKLKCTKMKQSLCAVSENIENSESVFKLTVPLKIALNLRDLFRRVVYEN